MIDFARIAVYGGRGGDGSGSFVHIKGKRRGKADGGDGGSGGNVYFEATNDLNTLEPFRFVKEYQASNGVSGLSKRRQGAQGKDLVLKVPVGSVVKVESQSRKSKSDTDEEKLSTSHFDFDLTEAGQRILIARGGEGGKGNSHLRDEFGRRPFQGGKGEEGEIVKCELELKLIADVGLVGMPNGGKSSLITALTSAKPKVASYPFTTLEPNLGVLQVSGIVGRWVSRQRKEPDDLQTYGPTNLVIADIPGLIEGASKGRGLGDLFLRHIERTKIIVHVIDISQNQDVLPAYQLIRNELKAYSKELVKKKEIIAINKIDLVSEKVWKSVVAIFRSKKKKTVAVSAKTGENLDSLVWEILKSLKPKS